MAQQAVDERLVRNYDVYSVLAQGAQMPYGPRPDVMMTVDNKQPRKHSFVLVLLSAAVVYLLYKSFKKRGGR